MMSFTYLASVPTDSPEPFTDRLWRARRTALRGHGPSRARPGAFVQEIPTVKRVRRIPRGGATGSSFADEMRKSGLEPRTR
jgi:hypothetical protein